jgi:hypothetical protein
MSLPLSPGRNEFGPAVVRVRTAKSAVAGDLFEEVLKFLKQ